MHAYIHTYIYIFVCRGKKRGGGGVAFNEVRHFDSLQQISEEDMICQHQNLQSAKA